MVAPSGEQYEISGNGYRAVVTESGAALRVLEYDGRPLVLGFEEDQTSSSGRGQLLAPWPNRIRDGRYSFGGRDHQLRADRARAPQRQPRPGPLGVLVGRGASTGHSVSLVHRLIEPARLPLDARPARALRPVRRRADHDTRPPPT